MDIDHFCIDSVCCKLLSCFKNRCNAKSVCDDGKVFSLAENDTFAKFKFIIRSVIDNRNGKTSESHVYRSLMLISSSNHSLCLDIIRRACNNHAWNYSHKGKILQTLMCSTILTYGNTAVSCSDLYVQLRIADGVTNLLISTSCCKHRESTCKGNLACGSDSCCDAHHVTLCDTAVNMTLRELFFEHACLCSCGKVSVQNDKILVFFTQLYKGTAIACSCCDFLYF